MAAPRLRLRRGTTAPSGSIALSGEPFVDTSAGNFYIASAASTFVHIGGSSYVDRVDESLVAAAATTSGTVKFKSRTDGSGGGSITFDSVDTANDSTYTWPDAPGENRILQSDTNGDLSWVSQTSGYTGWTIEADDTNTENITSGIGVHFVGGTGLTTTFDGTDNELTISPSGTLADVAGLATTNGGIIVGDGSNFVLESGATARASLGVDQAGTDNSTDVTLVTTTADYLSISGQAITLGQVDLTTDVTGDLPVADGGTGASSAADARTNLGVDAAGTDNSTDVTLAGSLDYITISGQTITRNAIDLAADVTGTLPAASVGDGITNDQLAGSIANSKLLNDSVSFGGVSLDLGQSDATPAFDLSDATNYPTSSLSGNITNAQLTNSTITVSDGSNSTATSLGGTITFSGTTGEVEVAESGGTVTVGLPNDVTIAGNLTVNGTTTTLSTTNTVVEDRLLELGTGTTGAPAATADLGLILERGSSSNVFIGFDEGDDVFVAGSTTSTGASTTATPTPIAFLALAYNVTDTAGTNQVVIGYNTSASQRELQNIVVDAGTY